MRTNCRGPTQSPFADLQITEEDEMKLDELAQMLVRSTCRQYDRHITDRKSYVNPDRWRRVATKDGLTIYTEQKKKKEKKPKLNLATSTTAHRSASSNRSGDTSNSTADFPVILGSGTLSGTLDDVMYGVVSPTPELMQLRTSYVGENGDDGTVLATLSDPILSLPYDSLVIKWFTTNGPNIISAMPMAKKQDFVVLEATGMTDLLHDNGEATRVGYHIWHSVHFPQTVHLDWAHRGNISICTMYRQVSDDMVDVYVRGIFSPVGKLQRSLHIRSAAQMILGIAKLPHCSHMKKLAYTMRRSGGNLKSMNMRKLAIANTNASSNGAPRPSNGPPCGCCLKLPSQASNLLPRSTCKACLQVVCSSCKIKHKVMLLPAVSRHSSFGCSDDGVHDAETSSSSNQSFSEKPRAIQKRITFCTKCVERARGASASEIATDEIACKDSVAGYAELTSALTSMLSIDPLEAEEDADDENNERRSSTL